MVRAIDRRDYRQVASSEVLRVQPDGSSGVSRWQRRSHVKLHACMQRMNAPLQRSTAAAEGQE